MKMLSVLFSLIFVGTALAQSGTAGNPNFDRANDWRSGKPNVLTIDSRDVSFDGSPVEVPFTLNGGPAEVHLAVYSRDANPQYDGAAFGEGGVGNSMLRAAGLDTLISITGGQSFSEGSNSITWGGRDFNGNEVGAGTYTYYLFALDNISNPTWVGPGSSHSYWMTNRVDLNVDPPVVWTSNQGAEWEIRRGELGLDYFQNPEAYESFLIPWMNERQGQEIQYWDISSYQPDPADPNVAYITNNAQFDVARGSGVWRVKFDPDNGTILPDEDWAAADRGYVHVNARIASSAVSQASHHSLGRRRRHDLSGQSRCRRTAGTGGCCGRPRHRRNRQYSRPERDLPARNGQPRSLGSRCGRPRDLRIWFMVQSNFASSPCHFRRRPHLAQPQWRRLSRSLFWRRGHGPRFCRRWS